MAGNRIKWIFVVALCVIQVLYYTGGNGVSGFFSPSLFGSFLSDPSKYFNDFIINITKKLAASREIDALGQYSSFGDIPGSVLSGRFFREIHLVGLPIVFLLSIFNGIRRNPSRINWLRIWILIPVIFLPVLLSITNGALIVWGIILISYWRLRAIKRKTTISGWESVLIRTLLLAMLSHLAVFLWLVIEIIFE